MEQENINELFEPIFEWLKEEYPNGAYLVIDKNVAKIYTNESLSVVSKEIRDYTKNVFENKPQENKQIMFTLNKDRLEEKNN